MTNTNFPPPLPQSQVSWAGSVAVAARCVAAEFRAGQIHMAYQVDDGERKQIRLPATAPLPRPGQPVLLFYEADQCQRFTTLPSPSRSSQ